jgi:serine/threonine protein phosphatase 1
VHAGLDPSLLNPMETSPFDCVWLREKFYNSGKIWEKTVIFGHTPTHLIGLQLGEVFIDDRYHLIGIDTGAVYGGALTCLIWPDRRIIQV